MDQKVTVKRGETVDIPLRIYGTRAQTLSWIVRERPRHGKLSGPRATAPEAALVTYTPPADLRFTSDRFKFSARSNEGVSAPAEVLMTIIDDDPDIAVPAELDFGALLTGTTAEKTIEFTNAGGGIAEGLLEVEKPWRLDGEPRYKLRAGERHAAKIVFAPDEGGIYESEIRFSSQSNRATALRGSAFEPLAVSPPALNLTHDPGHPLRAAGFELSNNSDKLLDVMVIASQRLLVPQTLHVPPHSKVAITVQSSESDVAAIDETMRFAAGEFTARLPVKAAALPAIVQARPPAISFGRVPARAVAKERIVLENAGGVATRVALSTAAPFSIEETAFVLDPKASREIEVTFSSPDSRSSRGTLKVVTNPRAFEIPLEAEVFGPAVVASSSKTLRRPASAPQRHSAPDLPQYDSPGISAATLVSAGESSATFEWPGEMPAGIVYRCLLRTLVAAADGTSASFSPYPHVRFDRRAGHTIATVEKLAPGRTYFFRFDVLASDGSISTPLSFGQVRIPARPEKPRASLLHLLIGLVVLTGGIALWQRRRQRSGF